MGNENLNGHHGRLRKRFMEGGIDGFLDYEVVELLLSLASRRDCKPSAKELIENHQSLRGVLEAPASQLQLVKGVGPGNVFGIKLVQSISRRYLKERIIGGDVIRNSSQLLEYLQHTLRDRNREAFLTVLLNGRNQILGIEKLFEGTLTSSAVYPREIIKLILERDAAAVIFVHNHPSGNPAPSKDDRLITDRLKAACSTIDVAVHDHLIIAGNTHTSFADLGYI